jgi:ribosomal protein S18 acetylase RimI-like enzyme
MEGYVEHSLNTSNWREVAHSSEGILGFLLGRIDGYPNVPVPKRSTLGELPQAIRSFFRKGRMTPWHISMVWGIVLTELKLMVKMPRSDASIEMFIVNSKHRGRGIGTELVDRFLRAAKEARSTLVTVYSDDRMSNWQFYERYGFEKIGTFHDNITSFYSGGDARGIILALDLRDEG